MYIHEKFMQQQLSDFTFMQPETAPLFVRSVEKESAFCPFSLFSRALALRL